MHRAHRRGLGIRHVLDSAGLSVSINGRGRVAFTPGHLLSLLLPPKIPLPSTVILAETWARINLHNQGCGLARAAPSWQGGWVILQAELDGGRAKRGSQRHIALSETGGSPGVVGEKGKEENTGDAGTGSGRLLSIYSRGVR